MGLARRGVLLILSLLLLISLIGLAFSVSTYLVLAKPAKLESDLKTSGFYGHFADNAIAQAASQGALGNEVFDFNNPVIQQAAHQSLSTQFLQRQGNQFINSNYDWLEGKQPKPTFTIDLTSARQDFANRVGQAVTNRLANLPACNRTQLAQLESNSNIDPLSISCLPPNIDPQTQGQSVTQDISQNSAFLNNSTISPQSISPDQSQPYYQKFSWAPRAYQLSLKAPYVWGGLTLLFILLLYLVARPKRRGTRRLGVVLLLAGLLLVLNKFLEDALFHYLQKQAFNAANNSTLQQSLLSVVHDVEAQLVRIDVYLGVAFLVLGLMMLLTLKFRPATSRAIAAQPFEHPASIDEPASTNRPGLDRTNLRATPPRQPTAPLLDPRATKPPNRKPPKLIQ